MQRFILALLICLIFPTFAVAKTHRPSKAHVYAPLTVYDYIHVSCRGQSCVDSDELKQIITEVSNDTGMNPLDLLTIIAIESSFNTRARNTVNYGLMQVNLAFHKAELHPDDKYDPRRNIEVGAAIYLACLDKRHGIRNDALRCYNGNGDSHYVNRFAKARAQLVLLVDLPSPTF
jgi:soluble lytic murein transglycosylase-like protein